MPHPRKEKGNEYEREVSAILTEWWDSSRFEFARTPNSGALRWNGISWTYGDILPPEDFLAIVECKHYKEIELDEVLRCKPTEKNVGGWWREVLADAQRCYDETRYPAQPLLVYRKNYWRTHRLVLESDFFGALGGRKLQLPAAWMTGTGVPPYVVTDLLEFLESVTPEQFRQAQKACIPAALLTLAA